MIAGFGGQGVMTMGKLLAEATSQATDLNVTFFPSYGAAMRGGTANCYVVISDEEIGAPVSTIVTDPIERDDIKVVKAPVTQMAIDIDNPRALNVIMLGVYVGATDAVPEEVIVKGIEHKFAAKEKLIAPNVEAFKMGLEIGRQQK